LEENFKFVGWTNTREILGISDFLVLPSTNEGFPLSVCEAFLMKVPVMRTKTGGFTDQKFCYPIDSNNPKDIEDIMIDIYTNGIEKYKKRAEEAYVFAVEKFTVEKMTADTVSVYRKVCGK
jgi:glycosyltransferase involved in cell wall biosynthesis